MSTESNEETNPITVEPVAKPPKRRWIIILTGILLILIGGGFGSWMGYTSAIQSRKSQTNNQVLMIAATQYNLALADQAAGRLDIARERLEYVIQLNPQFPGAITKLSEVMFKISLSQTPTVLPTPAPTPTPDTRGIDEVYNQARQFLINKDWSNTIANLEILRKDDLNYKAIEVDGMFYVALRNRGVDKILKEGSLEPGLYDLALAERFGPIDTQADGYRNWARLYLIGASFWELDWPQVLDYFSQIYPYVPNLHDKSGLTAVERFRQASVKYGDQLGSNNEWCKAEDQYKNALQISADSAVQTKLDNAHNNCSNPTSAPSETAKPTISATTPSPIVTTPPPVVETTPPPAVVTTEPAPVVTTPPPADPEPPTTP
jgi:tetratricopeptide (TPR) repeat protein